MPPEKVVKDNLTTKDYEALVEATPTTLGGAQPGFSHVEAALEREIRELEAELERAERRFECVVERYERLLEEKNRKLSELRGDEGGATATDGSLSAVLWWRDG